MPFKAFKCFQLLVKCEEKLAQINSRHNSLGGNKVVYFFKQCEGFVSTVPSSFKSIRKYDVFIKWHIQIDSKSFFSLKSIFL